MSIRFSRRLLTAGLLVAGATTAAAGPAHAGVATPAAVHAPAHHHGHGGNCNNDPSSAFAMDPYLCPPSKNADAYEGNYGYPDDDHGYGGYRGYGYGYGGYRGHGYPGGY